MIPSPGLQLSRWRFWLMAGLCCGLWLGCSPPTNPAADTEETSTAPSRPPESASTTTASGNKPETEPQETIRPDSPAQAPATDEPPTSDSAEQSSPTNPSELPSESPPVSPPSGSSAPSGGVPNHAAGSREHFPPPTDARQAAELADRSLKNSERATNPAEAYRQASRALFYARHFPEDAACLGLADAAAGRLKKLEAEQNSQSLPLHNGLLREAAIIETL